MAKSWPPRVSCVGRTGSKADLAEDGRVMPAAAGSGDFDGNARCMCTDALLAFTCRRLA